MIRLAKGLSISRRQSSNWETPGTREMKDKIPQNGPCTAIAYWYPSWLNMNVGKGVLWIWRCADLMDYRVIRWISFSDIPAVNGVFIRYMSNSGLIFSLSLFCFSGTRHIIQNWGSQVNPRMRECSSVFSLPFNQKTSICQSLVMADIPEDDFKENKHERVLPQGIGVSCTNAFESTY